jgi:hypothetical protein
MIKAIRSPNYNYNFSLETGAFFRWGKTPDVDPKYSPFGPEILDMEISTICHGINGTPCSHCYKSNSPKGKYMTIQTFERIFQKFDKSLTQIAFGIGDIDSNPDLEKILRVCRSEDVIPNITINGARLTTDLAEILIRNCGAIAVSRYEKDQCYDTVDLFTRSDKQTNIHMLLSEETYNECFNLVDDVINDPRLSKLNSIVFLLLKSKGKRNHYHVIQEEKPYRDLVNYCLDKNINFGFDSCFAPIFLKLVRKQENFKDLLKITETCESFGTFSAYVNVKGHYFPCSFVEGEGDWKRGLSVLTCKKFIDIWKGEKVKKWRRKSLTQSKNCECDVKEYCRPCLIFDIDSICKKID